jgi:REP element-mobilizing transposase RayT
MPDLYKNKFRVKSARWNGYNYSQAGCYFVTICAKNRDMFFGDVIDDKMVLSGAGEVARDFWLEILKHFNNTILDEFIVMPNHVHGIIVIKSENHGRDEAVPRLRLGKDEAVPRLYAGEYPQMSKISPKPKSLSVMIGSFKSVTTKTIRKKFPQNNFAWQERFYDRVIRNEFELNNVQNYILNNPSKWNRDRNNLENLFM